MTGQDLIVVVVAVGALCLFAGVLGFASWEESRARKSRARLAE